MDISSGAAKAADQDPGRDHLDGHGDDDPNPVWLGGGISASRDSELIENLITRVKGCASALGGPILFCVDGLTSYPKAILKVFREKEPGNVGLPILGLFHRGA